VCPADSGELVFGHLAPQLFDGARAGGSGDGLSISRSIVEAHDGQSWAEKIVGRGAIFHCLLPVARQTVVAVAR